MVPVQWSPSLFLRWTRAPAREAISSLAYSRFLSQDCIMEIYMKSSFCPWWVRTFLNTVNDAASQYQINSIYACLTKLRAYFISSAKSCVLLGTENSSLYSRWGHILKMMLSWWNVWCGPQVLKYGIFLKINYLFHLLF